MSKTVPAVLSVAALLSVVGSAGVAWGAGDEPMRAREGLVYPEGAAIPRSMTPTERDWVRTHPLGSLTDVATPAPTGPIHCTAEYEPVDGIIVSWDGSASWLNISAAMGARVTAANGGNANFYVALDTAGEQATADATLSAAGVNMSRVRYHVRTTDSIWLRDYGPRYVYQGDCRAIVDHTYNRPRPADDAYSISFASARGHAFYENPLVHGGGNFHLDANGRSYATRLINNENPGLTEAQIVNTWLSYQNVNTTLFTPFPTSVDATQHLDMWMQVLAADRVIVSDWPYNVGSVQDVICDNAAVTMQGLGYQVWRVPARSLSGTHYTYTNTVMCNGIVLVPSYTNAGMTAAPAIPGPGTVNLNTEAINTFAAALAGTGKTPEQINCENIISAAGAIHCIVMHMPAHKGLPGVNGLAPTAYLKNYNGGETLAPASSQSVQWISDDDKGPASSVTLLLSTDGGATYPTTIATGQAALGSFNWTVPNVTSSQCRIRVVASDADANTGFDISDANFRINGTCVGDTNGDGLRNFADLNKVLGEFGQSSSGASGFLGGDANGDGTVNFADLNLVLSNFGQAC